MLRSRPAVILATVVALAGAAGLASALRWRRGAERAEPFAIRTTDISGAPLCSEDFRGRMLVVHFFSLTPGPAQMDMETLENMQAELGTSDFAVVGISEDRSVEGRSLEETRAYTARLGITFPVAVDGDGSISAAYRVHVLPARYLFDRSGALRDVWHGSLFSPTRQAPAFGREVRALLSEPDT